MDAGFLWPVLGFVGGFAGSFAGNYLKKKGENLETREDIAGLTSVTKSIEAKISGDRWDRQKQWELRRDVLFDAVRKMSDIEQALISMYSTFQVEKGRAGSGGQVWEDVKTKEFTKWVGIAASFQEARLLVQVVCLEETSAALDAFAVYLGDIAVRLSSGGDLKVYERTLSERFRQRRLVQEAMRKELVIDVGVG